MISPPLNHNFIKHNKLSNALKSANLDKINPENFLTQLKLFGG